MGTHLLKVGNSGKKLDMEIFLVGIMTLNFLQMGILTTNSNQEFL